MGDLSFRVSKFGVATKPRDLGDFDKIEQRRQPRPVVRPSSLRHPDACFRQWPFHLVRQFRERQLRERAPTRELIDELAEL
jgi:hypothetical protein